MGDTTTVGEEVGGGAPTGPAGGELAGTYPNPTVNDGADATAIHSGDTASGDLAGTYPDPTVAANAITNTKAADMAANTIKIRNAASLGNPVDMAMGVSTILSRLASGDVKAATPSEIRILLGREFDAAVVITPPAFTADVDDYAPTGWATSYLVRVTPDVNNRDFGGMEAPSPARYKEVTIRNLHASNDLRFNHNSGSSLAVNRILLRDGGSRSIKPNESATFYYDITDLRWATLSRVG